MGKTRGVHETTPELRNRMVGMYEAGLGLREIAAAVNCSQRTVKRWLNRFDREGNVETRDRCGRKRATTSEQDDAIIQLATSTTITAAKAVLPALGLKCSVDTVRERLHKAGIHNWSPSRKHIRRILLGESDGAALEQAVWRPTGTHLGKKKLAKVPDRAKNPSKVKKKKVSNKKPKETNNTSSEANNAVNVNNETNINGNITANIDGNINTNDNGNVNRNIETDMNETNNNVNGSINQLNSPGVLEKQQDISPMINFNTPQPIIHCPNLPPEMAPSFQSQPQIYHQELNPWPVDLNPQSQPTYLLNQNHIPPTSSRLPELYPPNNLHHHHQTIQQPINHSLALSQTDLNQPNLNQNNVNQNSSNQSSMNQLASMTISESSNSSCDARAVDRRKNQQNNQPESVNTTNVGDSEDSGENSEGNGNEAEGKRKKGGKAKGTLETSVELRNRMIGMSQAGLSTLSIALAINRSERTVKRWLERWKKEGNVQTKERKGRRRITTKEQDEAIIAMATQSPLTAAKHVVPALGLQCSVDTIRERLHKAGIHSWKLGKKQGEGNAVHTVHLWQPSGNRPNRPRILKKSEEKKASGKRGEGPKEGRKRASKKNQPTAEVVEQQMPPPPPPPPPPLPATNIDQQPMQFHDNSGIGYSSGPNVLQPVGILTPINPVPGPPQQVQLVSPVMRPDCRLATAPVSQGYSSCMVNGGGHIEPQDPLNYEPYIWNF